ncbi:MAG TPA: polar amino acid ABC transporter permease, partial [Ruminococcaceae bacterium]|nr:polar amino acid ABC transporter permease [Oscillospiraceae bacterium]
MSFLEVTAQLADGFLMTLLIFGVTLVGAIPLGLLIMFGSMSKFQPVKWLFKIFVWIIRGTPLMLQIILVFYGPGLMGLGVKFDRLMAVILAFIINYACY